MLRPNAAARLAAVLMLAAGVSACGGIKLPGPPHLFGAGGEHKPVSKLKGERIPVLALNDKLTPSETLKDTGFQLPPAVALADWPQAGGEPDHAIEHVQAAQTLTIAWRKRFGPVPGATGHVTAQPVVADGRIFVMDGGATVSALEFQTGREIWKSSFVPRKGRDREGYGGGLAYADGKLFVTSGLRFVAALNASDGSVVWRHDSDVPIRGAPTVSGGRVYAVDAADQLVSYGTDGAPRLDLPGARGAGPVPTRILACSLGRDGGGALRVGRAHRAPGGQRHRALVLCPVAHQPQQRPV